MNIQVQYLNVHILEISLGYIITLSVYVVPTGWVPIASIFILIFDFWEIVLFYICAQLNV